MFSTFTLPLLIVVKCSRGENREMTVPSKIPERSSTQTLVAILYLTVCRLSRSGLRLPFFNNTHFRPMSIISNYPRWEDITNLNTELLGSKVWRWVVGSQIGNQLLAMFFETLLIFGMKLALVKPSSPEKCHGLKSSSLMGLTNHAMVNFIRAPRWYLSLDYSGRVHVWAY